MEEQKFGIENLKKIVAFGCDLTKQINQSLEDGWQWTDAINDLKLSLKDKADRR